MATPTIATRPSSRLDLGRWYESLLNDLDSSGQSVMQYAEAIGTTAATLYRWRRVSSHERPVNGYRPMGEGLDLEFLWCESP